LKVKLYFCFPFIEDDIRYKNLSKSISQQVFNITSSVANIQRLVSHLGTTKDTPELRAKL